MSDKKENNKLIPRLRFPEFKDSGEWKIEPLGNLSKFIKEKTKGNKYTLMSITAGKGLVTQLEKFGREIAGDSYRNYIVIRKGDFAYNKSSTKLYPQGEIAMLQDIEQAAVPNSIFTCFRFGKNKVLPLYAKYLFLNNIHGRWLINFISVGARAHGSLQVNNEDLFSIPLPFPSLPEQQKIAAFLSNLDELIGAHRQKLELLKRHKKGLMQNLFPQEGEKVPKLRFPEFKDSGEWEEKKIENICQKPFSGGTPNSTNKNYYGGKIPFIRSAEINKEKTELFLTQLGLENSSAKMVKKGDVLVAMYGANSGDVAISKIDGAINQAILCLRSKSSNEFLFQYLSYKKNWITSKYLQGGQGNLSSDIIKSIELLYPLPKEQQKIAACLSALDEVIAAQEEKIVQLEKHKKGLMQGVFP